MLEFDRRRLASSEQILCCYVSWQGFFPTVVATALFERDLTRDVQEVEEETCISSITKLCAEEKEGYSLVGPFTQFQQAQTRRGRKVTVQKQMKIETSRDQSATLLQKLEYKFVIVSRLIL